MCVYVMRTILRTRSTVQVSETAENADAVAKIAAWSMWLEWFPNGCCVSCLEERRCFHPNEPANRGRQLRTLNQDISR
jgi:hypothetical protein